MISAESLCERYKISRPDDGQAIVLANEAALETVICALGPNTGHSVFEAADCRMSTTFASTKRGALYASRNGQDVFVFIRRINLIEPYFQRFFPIPVTFSLMLSRLLVERKNMLLTVKKLAKMSPVKVKGRLGSLTLLFQGRNFT